MIAVVSKITCNVKYNWVFVLVPTGLTYWGRDKMTAISRTTFSNALSWMKKYAIWFKIHWSLFLRFQLTIYQHWFGYWLGAEQATSHYLNQWWPSLLTDICVSRPQWLENARGYVFVWNLGTFNSQHGVQLTINFAFFIHNFVYDIYILPFLLVKT